MASKPRGNEVFMAERYKAHLEAEVARLRTALDLTYSALDGIYIEELNGRICCMPSWEPDDGLYPVGDREAHTCPACVKHWERAGKALTQAREALRAQDGDQT